MESFNHHALPSLQVVFKCWTVDPLGVFSGWLSAITPRQTKPEHQDTSKTETVMTQVFSADCFMLHVSQLSAAAALMVMLQLLSSWWMLGCLLVRGAEWQSRYPAAVILQRELSSCCRLVYHGIKQWDNEIKGNDDRVSLINKWTGFKQVG